MFFVSRISYFSVHILFNTVLRTLDIIMKSVLFLVSSPAQSYLITSLQLNTNLLYFSIKYRSVIVHINFKKRMKYVFLLWIKLSYFTFSKEQFKNPKVTLSL